MKYEWRKEQPVYAKQKEEPAVITVPAGTFLTIAGQGNPNQEEFSQRVGVLYSLAYGIKSAYQALCAAQPETRPYTDFAVFPLEGVWTSTSTDPLEKDCFLYTLMIRQPDAIPPELYQDAFAATAKKKPHPLLAEARLEQIEEGLCVQALHKGSYDDEPSSFARMDAFCRKQGLVRRDERHHKEIYLSNPQRTAPEKRKTILRYGVERRG